LENKGKDRYALTEYQSKITLKKTIFHEGNFGLPFLQEISVLFLPLISPKKGGKVPPPCSLTLQVLTGIQIYIMP